RGRQSSRPSADRSTLENVATCFSGGNCDLAQDVCEDILSGGARLGSSVRRGAVHYETVFEDGMNKLFYIIRDNETAAVQHRKRLRRSEQCAGSARADTEFYFGVVSCAVHDLNHVIDYRIVDADLPALILKEKNVRGVQDC